MGSLGGPGGEKPAKYILKSKSGTNEHPIKPFDARICGIFSWPSAQVFLRSNHATMGSKWKLKNKSGMNGHPIRPFDTIICVSEFWAFQLSFLTLKPCNYGLQERLMSKKAAQKKRAPPKCSGHRKIIKPETIPSFYLAH